MMMMMMEEWVQCRSTIDDISSIVELVATSFCPWADCGTGGVGGVVQAASVGNVMHKIETKDVHKRKRWW